REPCRPAGDAGTIPRSPRRGPLENKAQFDPRQRGGPAMIENPLTKGWCPGALRPMQAGDGLLVRIRPPAGRLSAAQARGIAGVASRYGNGVIDISNRANLQVQGVRSEYHDALLSA